MFPTTCSGRLFHTGTVLGNNDLSHWCRGQWSEEVFLVGTWSAFDTALALVVRVVWCLGRSWDLMSSGSLSLCVIWRSPRPDMRWRCDKEYTSWFTWLSEHMLLCIRYCMQTSVFSRVFPAAIQASGAYSTVLLACALYTLALPSVSMYGETFMKTFIHFPTMVDAFDNSHQWHQNCHTSAVWFLQGAALLLV